MKINTIEREETRILKIKTYTCETCGKQSENISEIMDCEKEHIESVCEHEYEFTFDLEIDSYEDALDFDITKRCKKCDKRITKYLALYELDDFLVANPAIVQKLFETTQV